MPTETLITPAGHVVELIVEGAGSDLLVYHHGTPAAGPIDKVILDVAAQQDFTVVEVVRPGYAGSTRQPGRTVADVVPLVLAVADRFGAERFAVLGWSGGGPHALATAALAPERCAAALCLAGVAPYSAPGLDFLAGMGQDNIDEFGAALAGQQELAAYLGIAAEGLRDITGPQIVDAMSSLLPQVDRALLTEETGADLAAAFRHSVSTGFWGWFDDDVAFTRDWGFDLAAITVPTQVWQGTEDLMVPVAHGHWLAANVGSVIARVEDGEGHLSVGARAAREGIPLLKQALSAASGAADAGHQSDGR